jgi:dihydrofolate reductase
MTLIRTLMEQDLVDEYHVPVHAIVSGKGRRIFSDGEAACLQLIESKPTRFGVVLLHYQPVNK